jgi:DNA processing protein
VTNKQSWGPNTLIKQGAKLVATWEDVWEELPTDIKLRLEQEWAPATETPVTASLFDSQQFTAQEKKVLKVLKPDEALQIDEIIEALEPDVSSSEIFAALFELEMAGKIKQMPGKNYVRAF